MYKNYRIDTQEKIDNMKAIKEYLLTEVKLLDYEVNSLNVHTFNISDKQYISNIALINLSVFNCDKTLEEFKVYYLNEKLIFNEFCEKCENKIEYVIDSINRTITEIEKPCSLIEEIELKVIFPSGVVFVGDYLRLSEDIFDSLDGLENINYVSGQIEKSINYASKNIIHLFRGGDGIYLKTESNDSFILDSNFEDGILVDGDLSWLTIVDIDVVKGYIIKEFSSKSKELLKELDLRLQNLEYGSTLLNVTHGEYSVKFRPYDLNIKFNRNK